MSTSKVVPVSVEAPVPVPVSVEAVAEPIPVTIDPASIPAALDHVRLPPRVGVQTQATDPSLPAKTTFQEDLITASQRRVNLIWEFTQAFIAAIVVVANMVVGCYQGLISDGVHREHPVILSSALFLIVGFYFSRTNHEKIGGIGNKPQTGYQGR